MHFLAPCWDGSSSDYGRDGLVGDYDYAFLFKPNLPFMKKSQRSAPFFGLNDKMPILLALLLGLQHALAMLAGGRCKRQHPDPKGSRLTGG